MNLSNTLRQAQGYKKRAWLLFGLKIDSVERSIDDVDRTLYLIKCLDYSRHSAEKSYGSSPFSEKRQGDSATHFFIFIIQTAPFFCLATATMRQSSSLASKGR